MSYICKYLAIHIAGEPHTFSFVRPFTSHSSTFLTDQTVRLPLFYVVSSPRKAIYA